ncbi:hypothetical protein BTHI11S_03270 [Bosea thiooxidans]
MHHLDPKTRNAADLALDCYKHCHGMATTHCLAVGGAHVERGHLTLMLACAEICRTTAHLLLMDSRPWPAHGRRMRRNLRGLRQGLRKARRHGVLRRRLPRLCERLPGPGGLSLAAAAIA